MIASTVGTTEGYVFKEKSRLKAQGVLTDESFSVFSNSDGDETLTLARAEARTLTRPDLGTLTDIPPLGQEDLKKMYSEFQNGKTPVEVIATYGFNPMFVEYEYNRFCRMNGLNLRSLAHELDEALKKTTNDSLSSPLLQRLVQDGITCNDDLRELFKIASISSYSGGELAVIERMRKGDSIVEFNPFVCSICHKPMTGAMIDPESEIGRKLESIGSSIVHDKCNFGSTARVV